MSLEQQEYWSTHSRPMELEEGTIVENWLRSLDLIYYTQDFLDNGYDDLEVCKQIGEDDLNAIGVLEESHRAHILQAVKTLQEKGGTAVYFTLEERPTVYEDYALVGGVGGQGQRQEEGGETGQEEGGQEGQDAKGNTNADGEVQEHAPEEGDTSQMECPPVPSTVGTITTMSQEDGNGEGVQVQVDTHDKTVEEGVTTVVEDYADLPPPPPPLSTPPEGTITSLPAPDHPPPPPPPLLLPGDCPSTTSLSCTPPEEVPQCSTSSSCGGCDAYGEGKRALAAYPRLQLASLMRDRLMEEGITLDTATSPGEEWGGTSWNPYGMVSAYGHGNRSVPPPLPSCPPPDSTYADIGCSSPSKDGSPIRITTIRAPGNDDYTELIESEINNQKKSSSGITRFIKNVIGMTSGKKYTYRKHEGDLNASEITMADDERIELMLMVKEGKISMHDAVERVKAYERQHRCIEKSSPEKDGEHKRSPQLSSLLRRKSSDSRGSGSQESPRSKKSSSSTESSPGQRSRSGSRSRSRSATQTLVDFCPEEQLIVELSHPEGSTGVPSPGGATNISISVKPIDRPEPPPVKPKPKKDGGQGAGQQQGDSGAVLGCATPMCWMSPKRGRKYVSSSPENTLPHGGSPGVGDLDKSKQLTQAETHSTPPKSKKGSPSGGSSSGGGGEQKQRSFLRSPFSRRKRSSSSSSNSAKESPAQKPEEQKQYSQTLGRGPRPEPPPRPTLSGTDPTQATISSSGTQARTAQGAIATPSHTDSREASRSHITPTEQVYQHANLLYRKGSSSSSSSNSIQSQRDPRLLEAALLGQKRAKSPSPSSGSVQGSSPSPSSIVQPKNYSSNNGSSSSSSKGQGSKSKASNGTSTPSKGSGNNSRIPSYYSNPQRRSLNLSDGPDICSDSSSEGGRTRRSRTNSDAHSSNGTLKGSIRKSDYRSSSNDSLKKSSNNRTSGQLRKGKQPPKLTLPTSDGNHTGSDSDTSRTLSRSQVTRSSSGSRLPVNFRSSVDSLPRSPVSSSPRSPVCKQPQTDTLSKRHSGSHRSQNSNTSTDVEVRRRASATTRQGSKGTSTSTRISSKEATPRVHKTNGNDVTERRRRTSQLSVGSDTSNTSVESKRPAEQSDRTRIPRSTSGSTTNDECLTSDYDDGDMSDKNPDMFVRNSATRSSLSERVKGLGRDVKKKISRLKPNRMSMSKEPDEITSGACGDGSRSPDESRHSVLGLHAVSSSSGHSSLSQDETDATYRGPFVGRAKVIRDYTPSPYDREALTLKQGDVISIISMNETGMWRGMVGHRIGTFKFINVEMLPADSPQPSPIKRQPKMRGPRRPRPRTVHELLLRLGLSHLTTVFLLHGYHTLELFSELEEEDLDELCITTPEDRAKIITAAQLLVDYDNTESPESGTGSRPQTPAGLSLTPAGSTQTLTDQPTATPPEALPGYGPPAPHCLSALRAKPPRDTTSYVHIALDLRDSGCYASSETLQMQHADGSGGTPSKLATVDAGPTASSTTGVVSDGGGGGQSTGSEQPTVNSSQGEGIEGGGQGNGQEDNSQRHSGSDTGPVPVLSVPPEDGSEEKGEEDSPKTDPQTTPTSVLILPHSTQEEKGEEDAPEDADTTSESLDVFSRDSTPCSSPRIRVRPRVPMRRSSASPTSMVTTFGVGGACTEETTTTKEGTCELSPMRRFRPGGPAQRLSSQSSQNSISPCGSPPSQGSPMSPLGSPHTQTRSQSLPGSPLRSHSPSMLVHLPPRPHSPILHQHHPVHHRAAGSHRYSTPNIHALKQRLRPQIPERTSSLTSKAFSGSTDSINSGTQTPQLIYAENGISPTLGRQQQNGHLHLRRSSSPALRTYLSYTPPGSPQKSKLPTYTTSKTGSLPAGLVTRTDGGGSRRRQKAVSVTLEAIVVAKLDEEGIDLTQAPYTDTSGFCGIPPALVQRYAEELRREVAEIATAIDECRTRHLQNNGQVAVPNDFLVDSCNTPSFDIATSSVPDFLVSIGMPMYLEALVEHDRETIEEVKEMRESDWKKIGVTDPRHLRRLAQSTEILRARLIHADKQKQLRIAKLSQIRDKV